MKSKDTRRVFDNIHDYITLTQVEKRLMESMYYQRLRWIKQLGFTFYIYPGATHTRFAHALGVVHIMDRVLQSIGKAVSPQKLFNPLCQDESTIFHRSLRVAAMLHDVGTLPFSHTVELAYLKHWKHQVSHGLQVPKASHENLGRHIITQTDFPGGVTHILKSEGIDPVFVSQIINGVSPSLLANQLLHSDIDVDRMDYLLRDAYHTGTNFGRFDLDLLIENMTCATVEDQELLFVHEDAINWAEYFLICRYSWYSQIINDGTGYKFDLIAAKIYQYFLENGLAYSFDQLIEQVSQSPNEYFTFNDSYFMAKLHEYLSGRITHPIMRELSNMLACRIAPKQIKIAPVVPTLVANPEHRHELARKVQENIDWLEDEVKSLGPDAWMITDIPGKDVVFTKDLETLRKENPQANPLLYRDPIKVLGRDGQPKLLVEVSNSLMKILSQYRNFIPRIYVSDATYEKLEAKGILSQMQAQLEEASR